MFKRTISILAAAACVAQAAVVSTQAAEISRIADRCGSGVCAWYRAEVSAPHGWVSHETFGVNTKSVALLPKKQKLSEADPLISVRTVLNGTPEAVGGQSVERLADVRRADGKGVWQVYRIYAPGRTGEEHELIARGEQAESATKTFVISVSLSATSRTAVDHAEGAWREVLAQLDIAGPKQVITVAMSH